VRLRQLLQRVIAKINGTTFGLLDYSRSPFLWNGLKKLASDVLPIPDFNVGLYFGHPNGSV
jgi:hypothetical protein